MLALLSGINLKLVGIAVAVMMVIGLYMYVGHLRHEVLDLQTQNTTLTNNIKLQNSAIEQMKAESDKRLADAQVELKAAKDVAAKATVKAKNVYNAKPSTPTDTCKSALDLINGGGEAGDALKMMNGDAQ